MAEQAFLIENLITVSVNRLAGLHFCIIPLLKALNIQLQDD